MGDIVEFERDLPHTVAEVICINCKKRWISVFPSDTLLKDLQCPGCLESGYVIMTGQPVEDCD
jgi:hypothetical protein